MPFIWGSSIIADVQVNYGKLIVVGAIAVCGLIAAALGYMFPNKRRQIALSLIVGGFFTGALGIFFFYMFLDDHTDASGIAGAIGVVLGLICLVVGGLLFNISQRN